VAGIVLAAAILPLLAAHARQIWLRPHYQFFPLALLGSGVLAYLRLRDLGPLARGSRAASGLFLGLAWVLLAAATALYSSWLGAVASLILLAALLYTFGGARLFRRALPCWLLLWLAVPPPLELDRDLILALQSLTALWASAVLDLFGVFHVMAGNVVEIDGRRLLVEEACSGVNSLFSLLACTLFLAFLTRRSAGRTVLLLAVAVFWVLAANVGRVVVVVVLETRWGLPVSGGWRHEVLGLLCFGLAVALLWSTDQLLTFLLAPAAGQAETAPPPADTAGTPPGRRPPWGLALAAAVAFLPLAVAHQALYGLPGGTGGQHEASSLGALDAGALPDRLAGWKCEDFRAESRRPGSAFGEFSRTWTYRNGRQTALVSLDYPFPSWHDLTRCYTGQGWRLERQAVHAREGGAEGFVEVRLSKPSFRSGYLLFCQMDGSGRPLEPRPGGARLSLYRHESAFRRWQERLGGAEGLAPADPPGPVYQLQVFVESYAPLTGDEERKVRELLEEVSRGLGRHGPEAQAASRATR
jgi:exosortase